MNDPTVSVTELRKHLSSYIDAAESGSRINVKRGKDMVAIILPAQLFQGTVDLRNQGGAQYKIPKIKRARIKGKTTASAALKELRSLDSN